MLQDPFSICTDEIFGKFQNINFRKYDICEKWIIVYLNTCSDELQTNMENSLKQFSDIVSDIKLFNYVDECVDFLSNIRNDKVCLTLRKDHIQTLIPLIHDISQLKLIYIHYEKENIHELKINKWTKIKGSFTHMTEFCQQFKKNIRKYEDDLVPIGFMTPLTKNKKNELDASFMYSQLLKDLLLVKQYDANAKKDFINYLRTKDANEPSRLRALNESEQGNPPRSSLWWYTKEPLFYERLNKALRTQDTDTIVHMGVYIQDLHRTIHKLHREQQLKEKLVVYRGQRMCKKDFQKLTENEGGLLFFNNFLSTSKEKIVSSMFADSSSSQEGFVGLCFHIEIDPSISSTPFAFIGQTTQHEDEEEILFSMHTIFHIAKIIHISENSCQVNLTLTNENDETLKQVTDYMHQQIRIGSVDKSITYLLMRMGHYDIAEKICNTILESTSIDMHTRLQTYRMLGGIKHGQGDHNTALSYYQSILDTTPSSPEYDYIDLVDVFCNMGVIHELIGNYPTACEFFEIVAEIREKSFTYNGFDLATMYNNIAVIKSSIGHYPTALEYFQKSLDIVQNLLPPAHPDLALIYNNIGMIHNTIGKREAAYQYFKKALEIQKRSLPEIHSDISGTLNNLAVISHCMGQYETAINYYQESVKIFKEVHSSEHSSLALIYNNIAQSRKALGQYDEAIVYHLKAIEIREKSLSTTDFKLPVFYINVAFTYNLLAKSSQTHDYLKKAYDMQKLSLSPDHSEWARTYNTIGIVYQTEEKYDKANRFYKKAIDIQEKNLSSTHPDIAALYSNIAYTEFRLGNGLIALDYLERTLRVQEMHLPPTHAESGRTYCNMGSISLGMGKCSDARLYLTKALDIQRMVLPTKHPELAKTLHNLGILSCAEGDYVSGLEHLQAAREILSEHLPFDHPDLAKIDDAILKAQSQMSF